MKLPKGFFAGMVAGFLLVMVVAAVPMRTGMKESYQRGLRDQRVADYVAESNRRWRETSCDRDGTGAHDGRGRHTLYVRNDPRCKT